MLIDEWMPAWDAAERHETRIRAGRGVVWGAVLHADFMRSPVVRGLLALRSLPARLSGRKRREPPGSTLDLMLRGGFVVLAEEPETELVLGLAGRFWKPRGSIVRATADELRSFDRPGYAVAAMNFFLSDDGDAVRLVTETRVRCTDAASRRSFRRYWRVIGPFSGLIRIEMLRAIRRAAETAPHPSSTTA